VDVTARVLLLLLNGNNFRVKSRNESSEKEKIINYILFLLQVYFL